MFLSLQGCSVTISNTLQGREIRQHKKRLFPTTTPSSFSKHGKSREKYMEFSQKRMKGNSNIHPTVNSTCLSEKKYTKK
ncbi:hypothetical protein E2C01_094530 [Portunus trituberculatus]|uniref:Uncharacterized protein n=1 Tax=Portunus trituberculatus TaxID=210409 RepID=A0A5B7K3F2_PORTR|nr:hypothetical protein [Portunus trituberculatus]